MSVELPPSSNAAMEFQAVVLAGGPGARLEPMTRSQAKSLLPIANRPMLHYPLKLLERAGFQDVIVAAGPGNRDAIAEYVTEFMQTSTMRAEVVCVKHADDTADVLRELSDKLTSDSFVLVSGDVVTEASLQELMDVHRTKDSTATMLLSEQSVDKLERKKMRKAADGIVDYFGVAACGKRDVSPRVVMMQSGGSEEPLVVSKALLKREPRFTVKTNLVDAHVYIMKRWVLDLLAENAATIASVRHDLMPYLIALQHRGPEALSGEFEQCVIILLFKPYLLLFFVCQRLLLHSINES
jgi:translation initiation factor eIF-2B subunit gamma